MTCCSRLALLPLRLRPPTLGRRSVLSEPSLSAVTLPSRSLAEDADRPRLKTAPADDFEALGAVFRDDTRRSISMLYVLRAASSASLSNLFLYGGSARSRGRISFDSSDLGLDFGGAWMVAPPREAPEEPGTAPTVKPLGLPMFIGWIEELRGDEAVATALLLDVGT